MIFQQCYTIQIHTLFQILHFPYNIQSWGKHTFLLAKTSNVEIGLNEPYHENPCFILLFGFCLIMISCLTSTVNS